MGFADRILKAGAAALTLEAAVMPAITPATAATPVSGDNVKESKIPQGFQTSEEALNNFLAQNGMSLADNATLSKTSLPATAQGGPVTPELNSPASTAVSIATGGCRRAHVADLNGDGKVSPTFKDSRAQFNDFLAANNLTMAGETASPDATRATKANMAQATSGLNAVSFDAASVYEASPAANKAVASGKIRPGNGRPDVVVANSSLGTITTFLNDDQGNYLPPVAYNPGGSIESIAIGDLNEDGKGDLVMNNFFPGVHTRIALGNGNGTYSPPTDIGNAGVVAPQSVAIGDVNGDGDLDVVAGFGDGTGPGLSCYVEVSLGNGTGGFSSGVDFPTGPNPNQILLTDVDMDGSCSHDVMASCKPLALAGGR